VDNGDIGDFIAVRRGAAYGRRKAQRSKAVRLCERALLETAAITCLDVALIAVLWLALSNNECQTAKASAPRFGSSANNKET
jgi:hypothetical protein